MAQLGIGEALGQITEHHQRREQRQHGRVAEAQAADALALDYLRRGQRAELVVAQRRVVAQLLDVPQTSVGRESHLPQRGEVVRSFPETEIARGVDRQFRPQRAVLLESAAGGWFRLIDELL